MSEESKAELVFIPSPGRGHLVATLEMANQLINRDQRLSVTVLVIKPFFPDPESSAHTYSHDHSNSRIRFIDLPRPEPSPSMSTTDEKYSHLFFHVQFIESHKDHVRKAVTELVRNLGPSRKLAGLVVDMFFVSMMDVADEFSVPTYVFFTSGASLVGLVFHFQGLRDHQNEDLAVYENSIEDLSIPSYKFPVPVKLFPALLFHKDGVFLDLVKKFRQTKGILVNTFSEFEPHAIKSLSDDEKIPPIYSIGPILHVDDNANDGQNTRHVEIIKWLDERPNSSVVFLCFGSKGFFDETQVKEIAFALERSGRRFLWSLRKPPKKFEAPGEYENPDEVLPEGFLERTRGIGKVIGWAPQVAVLSHPAVGGFVTHCGWNSTLESVWCGVPMAVWPLFAEQQLNAFKLVRELGVAVDIKMDYKKGSDVIVTAEEIEDGIGRLMEARRDVIRVNVEVMRTKSRMAVVEGGLSFDSMGRFIDDVINNNTS